MSDPRLFGKVGDLANHSNRSIESHAIDILDRIYDMILSIRSDIAYNIVVQILAQI
jgi:hypothetical protein